MNETKSEEPAKFLPPQPSNEQIRVRCPLWRQELLMEFAPYEVKTLRLTCKGIEETDAIEGLLERHR